MFYSLAFKASSAVKSFPDFKAYSPSRVPALSRSKLTIKNGGQIPTRAAFNPIVLSADITHNVATDFPSPND